MNSYKTVRYIVPTACFCLFYMSLWNAPFLLVDDFPFLVVLSLSAVAFFTYGKMPDKRAQYFYLIFALFTLAGAFLSLFRAPVFDVALYNCTLLIFNFIIFFFYIPILSVDRTRLIVAGTHVLVASVWCMEIVGLVSRRGHISYSTFAETGSNKNHIGFCLAISAIICFYCAINGQLKTRKQSICFQVGCLILTIVNFYGMSLIYARGSLGAAVVGVAFIMAISLRDRDRFGRRSLVKKGLVFVLLTASIFVVAPVVLERAPSWEQLYANMTEGGGEKGSIGDRKMLIQKGFAIIGDNPVLGLGPGGGRHAYGVHSVGLMHNTYLATWVDLGVVGFLSLFYWMYRTFKILKSGIVNMRPIDKIWIAVSIGIFAGMLLKDLGTLTFVLVTILAATISDYRGYPTKR